MILIIGLVILFLIAFMYIEPIFIKHKIKNASEYGSARFSTNAEIKKYK